MKLLYTSDLHGGRQHYQMLLDLLRRRSCDVLILGGDMTPDGAWQNPHPQVCEFIRVDFRGFLEQAHKICPDLAVFYVFGNHDWSFAIEEVAALQQQGLLMTLSHEQMVELDGMSFLGLSYSPPSPYTIKDFERRDLHDSDLTDFDGGVWSLQKSRLEPASAKEFFAAHESLEEMLAAAPKPKGQMVLVAHASPAETNLDLLPEFGHVGSWAVRRFIEQAQPILSLHGHIHEAPQVSGHFTHKIGGCLCVNPGQERQRLCAVRWDSEHPGRIEHNLGYTA